MCLLCTPVYFYLYIGLPFDKIQKLVSLLQPITFHKGGKDIYTEGKCTTKIMLVLEGFVEVTIPESYFRKKNLDAKLRNAGNSTSTVSAGDDGELSAEDFRELHPWSTQGGLTERGDDVDFRRKSPS